MHWWLKKLHPLACGAVTFGLLQAVQNVNYNQLWFQLVISLLTGFLGAVLKLFGVELPTGSTSGSSSAFSSLFA
jgi:hypothetical protein